ncbi:MAG: O-antigen ligase family protein [Acholeplasmataceae bacterium]|nr:O-antigen ligase family protein [Acholeplasmataceae bacterium]
MKRIEKFLNSGWYIALIFAITYLSWLFYEDTPPQAFNRYNLMGFFILASLLFLLMLFYENTMYTMPVILSFLFILNKKDMTFTTTVTEWWIYVALALVLLGPIVHWLRFRPKLKMGYFTLGLGLIALSYVLSMLHFPFEIEAVPVSMIGVIYFGFYLFLTATTKGRLKYLFQIFLFLNFLFTLQLGTYLYRGYLLHPELSFVDRLFVGWGRNLGWANVNDMAFYIALTLPAYVYFIFKKPKINWFLWFLMAPPFIVIILSESRGGIIGFMISFISLIIFVILKGRFKILIQMAVFLLFIGLLFLYYQEVLFKWWDTMYQSFKSDINTVSSGRINIYLEGLAVFKQYPIFGGGWTSLQKLHPGSRLFMYHSTPIQALAAMGSFGMVALLIHYYQVFSFYIRRISFEKWLFLIGYLASQAHGLIDNVQYAVPYSIIMVVVFALWENAPKTDFTLLKGRYRYEPEAEITIPRSKKRNERAMSIS